MPSPFSLAEQEKLYENAISKGREARDLESFEQFGKDAGNMLSLYSVDSGPLRRNAQESYEKTLRQCEISAGQFFFVEVASPGGRSHRIHDPSRWEKEKWGLDMQRHQQTQGQLSSDLRAIGQFTVVNDHAKSVIWHTATRSTCAKDGPNFYREDHKADIGYRTVERVVVFGAAELTLKEPENRSSLFLSSNLQTVYSIRIDKLQNSIRGEGRQERSKVIRQSWVMAAEIFIVFYERYKKRDENKPGGYVEYSEKDDLRQSGRVGRIDLKLEVSTYLYAMQ